MDKSNEIFKQYHELKKKVAAELGRADVEYSELERGMFEMELSLSLCNCMADAIEKNGYNIALADVCKNLDLDVTYFTDKNRLYMNEIDYFVPIKGSSTYFKTCELERYHFWERRLLKWKKIFVNRDSIISFLTKNMYITFQINNEEQVALIDSNIANYLLDNRILYRRCNIKELVIERKRSDFIRKTVGDIKAYKKAHAQDDDYETIKAYCDQEIELTKKLDTKDLALTANNKEVGDYIATHSNQRLYLRGDKEVTTYMFLPSLTGKI